MHKNAQKSELMQNINNFNSNRNWEKVRKEIRSDTLRLNSSECDSFPFHLVNLTFFIRDETND